MSKVIVSLPGGKAIFTEELPREATTVSVEYAQRLVDQLGKTDGRNYQLCTKPQVASDEDEERNLLPGDVLISIADFGPRTN